MWADTMSEVEEVFDRVDEYFRSGVRLVWIIHPKHQFVCVHESLQKFRHLARNDSLDGGIVLPGFQFPLAQLFPVGT
jgi:Uma2 family endonuclease